jgi:hypothetical protein
MKTQQDGESRLITFAQRGDVDAFNLLALKYQDMLYRVSLRIINEECAAQDAAQNAADPGVSKYPVVSRRVLQELAGACGGQRQL